MQYPPYARRMGKIADAFKRFFIILSYTSKWINSCWFLNKFWGLSPILAYFVFFFLLQKNNLIFRFFHSLFISFHLFLLLFSIPNPKWVRLVILLLCIWLWIRWLIHVLDNERMNACLYDSETQTKTKILESFSIIVYNACDSIVTQSHCVKWYGKEICLSYKAMLKQNIIYLRVSQWYFDVQRLSTKLYSPI